MAAVPRAAPVNILRVLMMRSQALQGCELACPAAIKVRWLAAQRGRPSCRSSGDNSGCGWRLLTPDRLTWIVDGGCCCLLVVLSAAPVLPDAGGPVVAGSDAWGNDGARSPWM